MERNRKSIETIAEELIKLLQENDEPNWAAYLNRFLAGYESPNTQADAVRNLLKIYKGGMGSFTDLVLEKDLKMLVKENNQLVNLKHELYNACLDYTANHQIDTE